MFDSGRNLSQEQVHLAQAAPRFVRLVAPSGGRRLGRVEGLLAERRVTLPGRGWSVVDEDPIEVRRPPTMGVAQVVERDTDTDQDNAGELIADADGFMVLTTRAAARKAYKAASMQGRAAIEGPGGKAQDEMTSVLDEVLKDGA